RLDERLYEIDDSAPDNGNADAEQDEGREPQENDRAGLAEILNETRGKAVTEEHTDGNDCHTHEVGNHIRRSPPAWTLRTRPKRNRHRYRAGANGQRKC